jgi:hypothetical protein
MLENLTTINLYKEMYEIMRKIKKDQAIYAGGLR